MTLPNDHLNNNGGMNATAFVSEEFFDDDDDALFGSSLLAGAPTAVTSNNEPSSPPSQQQRTSSFFGMAELSYNDVSKLNHGGGEKSGLLPTPPTVLDSNINNNINAANDDDEDDYVLTDEDDLELLELDQRYLSTLRNPNSKYINVAKSCLALHQFIYSGAAGGSQNNSTALFDDADSAAISSIDTTNNNNTTSSSTQQPMIIQIEHSSPIYQINKYQNTIHAILTSLTKCLSFHNSPRCRILALNTLANIARSSYAKLHFDTQVACISSSSTKLSSVSTTRVQDECGVGTAYTMVNAVLDQVNDNVSASALDALGKLTLDTCYCMDELNAEVRRIAECVNYCGSAYNNMNENEHPSTTDHQSTIRNMSFKIYEYVIFPRMSSILHRLTLYPSNGHIAKALPIINAVFVHALTYGKDTMPSRRAIQSNKISHGKRGWREVNAEGLVTEYVMGILLPLLSSLDGGGVDTTLQRGIAVSCLRMSSVSPCATWRVTACRCAATVLLRQLNSEMGTTSSSPPPPHSRQILSKQPLLSNKKANNNSKDAHSSSSLSPISSTILSSALVPPETLAGTAAMLIIALRGIPLHERAPGLSAVLRATLLYLPMGISVSSGVNSLDLPIGTDGKSSYRLGRTGLLTEVVLSIMLDGTSNARVSGGVEGDSSTTEKNDTQRIAGTRSVLLQRILQSDQLTPVWEEGLSSSNKNDHPSPVHELLWVLCTVTIQVGDERARLFAQDAVSVVEWNNLGLVILDFFAGIVCNPTASKSSSLHPFTNASYAAYNGLFLDVLKRCGAFPPTTLSISENMLHGTGDSSTSSPTVVGGPGKSLHHDTALSLSGIGTKIIFLGDKAKINNGVVHNGAASSLIEVSSNVVQLVALLVDTWLGCCIMNHDAKQTNSKQLDTGLMFVPLCHGEIKMLLQHHSSSTEEESVGVAAQNGQVFIACLENVACMSELLVSTGGGETNNAEDTQKNVGQLAVSMLNEIIASAKEGAPTDSEQGTWLRYQIALDATNAIARISKCINNLPQSYPEDIASTFQVSPLIANAKPKALSSSLPCHHKSMENCVLFLYNHARLVTVHRTSIAAKAVASTTYMSGMLSSKKLIRPRDALRLKGSFSHSTIQVYEKVSGLPLLIPARSSNSDQAVTLTGSSDPVSLLLSHGMRRVRKGDSTEGLALVITMRVFNVTPVPIRNGVRLELRISRSSGKDMVYDGSTSCIATSLYNHEIPPGDFVTWEVTLNGEVASTGLSLQPYVTFRGMEKEKESSTQKWVSGAGDKPTDATLDNDEIETTLDVVTLPCMSTLVPPIMSLLPCPLVFYGGIDQCKSNGGHGDAASFEFLWQYMGKEGQRTIPFVISTAQIEGNTVKTFAHTRRDCVTLDNNANKTRIGFAFQLMGGSRIFCTYQTNRGGGDYALLVRSDSSNLLETFVGTDALQALFLHFIFGKNASVEGTARLTR